MPLIPFVKKKTLDEYNTTYTVDECLYLKAIYFRYVTTQKNYGDLPVYTDYDGSGVLTQYNEAVEYYNSNNNFTNNISTGVVTFNQPAFGRLNYYVVPYTDDNLEFVNNDVQALSGMCASFDINNKTYAKPYTYAQPAIGLFNNIITQTQTVCDNANYFLKTDISITTASFTISLVSSVLTLSTGDDYVANLKKLHILKKIINSIKISSNFTSVNTDSSALKTEYTSSGLRGTSQVTKGVRVKTLFENLSTALDSVISIYKGVLKYIYDAAVANASDKLTTATGLIHTSSNKNAIALSSKNTAIDSTTGKAKLAADAKSTADTAKGLADSAKRAADTAKTDADTAKTADTYLESKNKAADAKTAADTAKTAADTAKTAADTAKNAVNQANTDATQAKTAAENAQTAATQAKTAAENAQTAATLTNTAADTVVKLINLLNTSIANENTINNTTTPTIPIFDNSLASAAVYEAGTNVSTANGYVSALAPYVTVGNSLNASTIAATAQTAVETAQTAVETAQRAVDAANTLAGQNILNKYDGNYTNGSFTATPTDSIQTNTAYINKQTRELYQIAGTNVDTYKSQYSQTMALGAILTIIMSALIYFVFSNIYSEGLGSSGNGSSNMPLSNGLPRT